MGTPRVCRYRGAHPHLQRWLQTRDDRFKGSFGFNAATDEYGDLVAMGVLDPTKVVRVALQNAASIAGLMITTEAMVAEAPREPAPVMPETGGMM